VLDRHSGSSHRGSEVDVSAAEARETGPDQGDSHGEQEHERQRFQLFGRNEWDVAEWRQI
jgi:hypothetical protein